MRNKRPVAMAAIRVGAVLALSATAAPAQEMRFFYPMPDSGAVRVQRDVQYAASDTSRLHMDVYRPAGVAGASAPALIFFNLAVGPQRGFEFYVAWARIAASKGLVAIVPDLRREKAAQDFQQLVDHLGTRAADYGIDRDAIAVYAGSGNVSTALPIVEDPRQVSVKAAVMFYGLANVPAFRRDLPLLYVRAGLDRPGLNGAQTSGITALAAQAVAQNAPITLLNHPFGHHAFEIVDDDAGTRAVIDATIDFVKQATSSGYQAALRRGLSEATAAADVVVGNFQSAATIYAEILAGRPDDTRLRLSYGEALLGAGQFAAACTEFGRLRGKGLGPRDLGLPAARACLQSGDPDAAIAWLQSIPRRFLPPSVETDPAFAALQSREDFRALFRP